MTNRVLKSLFMAASLFPPMANAKTNIVADAPSGQPNMAVLTRCVVATMPDKTRLVFGEWKSVTEDATLVMRGAVSLVVYDFPNGKEYKTLEDEKGVTVFNEAGVSKPATPPLQDEHERIKTQLNNICDISNDIGGNDAGRIDRLDIITRQFFGRVGKNFAQPAPAPQPNAPPQTPTTPTPQVRGAEMG